MDASTFRTGDWLLVAGGVVMLVPAQLLDWATVDSERGSGGLNNAFDYPLTGGIAWALTVLAGVLAFVLAAGMLQPGKAPWSVILLGATGLAAVLMVVRLILGAGEITRPAITYDLQRGPGMYVAFVAATLALAGAALNHRPVLRSSPDGATTEGQNVINESEAPQPSAHPPLSD